MEVSGESSTPLATVRGVGYKLESGDAQPQAEAQSCVRAGSIGCDSHCRIARAQHCPF